MHLFNRPRNIGAGLLARGRYLPKNICVFQALSLSPPPTSLLSPRCLSSLYLALEKSGELDLDNHVQPPLPCLVSVPLATALHTAMPFSGIFTLLYYIIVSFADAPFQANGSTASNAAYRRLSRRRPLSNTLYKFYLLFIYYQPST
jgi:hypothetical protein